MNKFFPSRTWLKILGLSTAVLLTLGACSQENSRDTDTVQAAAYLDIADVYRRQGQYRAASIELQNALQLAPGDDRALRLLSRINLDVGNPGQARQVLETLRSRDPGNLETTMMLAEAYLAVGEFERTINLLENLAPQDTELTEQRYWLLGRAYTLNSNRAGAQQAFETVLASNPTHVRALLGLSQLAYAYSDLEAARSWLDQAEEAGENDVDMWIWNGVYSTLNGQYLDAELAFKEALEVMGNYDMMTAKRFSVLQAIQTPLQMQQKNAEALQYAQIIAETPQGQYQSSFNNAVALFERGDYDAAEEALESSLTVAPGNSQSSMLLGMTNYALGDFAAAADTLSRYIDVASDAQPVKTLAAAQIQLGNPENAVSILREVRDRFPQDASLLAMLGISEQAAGMVEDSVATFNDALAVDPDFGPTHFSLSSSYFQLGDVESAVASLERALALMPELNEAKTSLISILVAQGDFDAARARIDGWLTQDPGSAFNNILAANVAGSAGNTEQARNYFNNALRAEPGNRQARVGLAGVAISEEDYLQAQTEYNSLLARQPTDAEAIRGLLATSRLQGNVAEIIGQVQNLVSEYPAAYEPPLTLSQFMLSQGEMDQALEFAQIAFDRNQVAPTRANLINILLNQATRAGNSQDLATATQKVDQALALQGDNPSTLIVAARVAQAAGDSAAVDSYVDQLKTLQPDSGLGFEVEGDLLLAANDQQAALNAFRRAWETGQGSSAGNKLYLTLARSGQQQEAQQFLREWIAASPADGTANMYVAMNHQQEGREDEAIDNYEAAVRAAPNNVVALNNLAWLYREDNPDRALQLAGRAASLAPENANVLDTYGWILHQQGQSQQAQQVLERALQLAPDSSSIEEHLNAARAQ